MIPSNQDVDVSGIATITSPFISQSAAVISRREQAVCVKQAYKTYGSKSNKNVVLDGLNMTVHKGSIYGLLGASGCGKTTLLSCIIGRRCLNSGEIWVLGGKPSAKGSGVPGPRIGYMPQEIALYGEFTMEETLKYFGWVAGMTNKQVNQKINSLLKLLHLPNEDMFVKNLSYGQQRRMSLAAALIHDPELLILDEPTVGVDPILRANIWNHLVEITNTGIKTVIITTHYIAETRQAHMIGLMRDGKFLAEESPKILLEQYGCDSLEDVFLKLVILHNPSKKQNRLSSIEQDNLEQIPTSRTNDAFDISSENNGEFSSDNMSVELKKIDILTTNSHSSLPMEEQPSGLYDNLSIFKRNHIKAVIWKDFLWLWRNLQMMLLIILLPCIQVTIYFWGIGNDPTSLKLAISNHEVNDHVFLLGECPITTGCNYTMLSCRFLEILKRKQMVLEYFTSDEDAFAEVKRGSAWGALVFSHNYSESLEKRTNEILNIDDWILESSNIIVQLDMSNQPIAIVLYQIILFSFLEFINNLLNECNINPRIGGTPIKWEEPIYGEESPNFKNFAASGFILNLVFILSLTLSTATMIIEKNDGMFERCIVTGITGMEMLFAHIVTHSIIMSGQTVLVLIYSFYIFNLELNGDILLIILLTLLTGLCGISCGFVISSACEIERTTQIISMGIFMSMIMMCGMLWPLEGMYPLLKYIAVCLPLTKSIESFRAITQRGWSIKEPVVFVGFLSPVIWILIFLTISILLIKFKKG